MENIIAYIFFSTLKGDMGMAIYLNSENTPRAGLCPIGGKYLKGDLQQIIDNGAQIPVEYAAGIIAEKGGRVINVKWFEKCQSKDILMPNDNGTTIILSQAQVTMAESLWRSHIKPLGEVAGNGKLAAIKYLKTFGLNIKQALDFCNEKFETNEPKS